MTRRLAADIVGYSALMGADHEGTLAVWRWLRGHGAPWRVSACAHAHLGDLDQAHATLAEALRLVPEQTIAFGRERSRYHDTPGTRRWFVGLRTAGMPEGEA